MVIITCEDEVASVEAAAVVVVSAVLPPFEEQLVSNTEPLRLAKPKLASAPADALQNERREYMIISPFYPSLRWFVVSVTKLQCVTLTDKESSKKEKSVYGTIRW
jgi:hypothetical protein